MDGRAKCWSSVMLLWGGLHCRNETRYCFDTEYPSEAHLKPKSLRWRHNGRDGVSNHQPYDCLLNRLFGHRSKKTSKLRATGLCAGIPRTNGQ